MERGRIARTDLPNGVTVSTIDREAKSNDVLFNPLAGFFMAFDSMTDVLQPRLPKSEFKNNFETLVYTGALPRGEIEMRRQPTLAAAEKLHARLVAKYKKMTKEQVQAEVAKTKELQVAKRAKLKESK